MIEFRGMTRDDIISGVRNAFANIPRPGMFIRGTCKCEECLEHERTMQSFTPDALPLEKLDNPGWDPICFASDEAFGYLMLGLVRLALSHTDHYIQQFLFHLDHPERVGSFTPSQAGALIRVLDFLVLNEAEALDNNLVVDELYRTRERLEQCRGGLLS
jgi:hypothetical protein